MSSGLLASNCMLTEPGATLSQFAGEVIGRKSLLNDVVIEMEDPRCKIAAIEVEDPRCKNLLSGVEIEVEDPRCKSLYYRVALEMEDSRCKRATVKIEDPRCKSGLMIW